MRRLALTAVVALALAAPASAQIVGRHDYGDVPRVDRLGPDGRLPGPHPAREARDIRGDIRNARDSGAISDRDARRLGREARLIGHLSHRYGRDGMSRSEAGELQARALALRSALVAAQGRREPRRGRGR